MSFRDISKYGLNVASANSNQRGDDASGPTNYWAAMLRFTDAYMRHYGELVKHAFCTIYQRYLYIDLNISLDVILMIHKMFQSYL